MQSYKFYTIITKERKRIRNKTHSTGTILVLVQLSLLSTCLLKVPVSLTYKRECWNGSDRGMPKFPEKWYYVHHKSPIRTGPEDEPGSTRWDASNCLSHGTAPHHSGNNSIINQLETRWNKAKLQAMKLVSQKVSYRGADKSLARPGSKQARKHVRDARDFNNIETRAVIKFFFSYKARRRTKFTPFW